MWFDKKKCEGVKCDKCKGAGKIIEFTVGLGNQALVPAYVEVPCPKCKGDGVISPKDCKDWKDVKELKKSGCTTSTFEVPVTQEYVLPDSFFVEKWLTKLFNKKS